MRRPMSMVACVGILLGLYVPPLASAGETGGDHQDSDRAFVQVAERVPSFGGAYLDGDIYVDPDVTLFVWLTELDEEGLAEASAALREIIGEPYTVPTVRPLQAQFSFKELYEWKQLASGQLVDGDVTYVDIDDRSNRLEIGLRKGASEEGTARALESRGVPVDAVRFVEAGPFRKLGDGQREADGLLKGWRPLALACLLAVVAVGMTAYAVRGRVLRRVCRGGHRATTKRTFNVE